MTATTERPRPAPSRTTDATNLRLYLVASLATAYVMAWWVFGGRPPTSSVGALVTEVVEPAPAATSRQPARAAWIDDLPPTNRPVVEVPAGWHIADRTAPSPSVTRRAVPRPVRASPSRPGRIRTRSS